MKRTRVKYDAMIRCPACGMRRRPRHLFTLQRPARAMVPVDPWSWRPGDPFHTVGPFPAGTIICRRHTILTVRQHGHARGARNAQAGRPGPFEAQA